MGEPDQVVAALNASFRAEAIEHHRDPREVARADLVRWCNRHGLPVPPRPKLRHSA